MRHCDDIGIVEDDDYKMILMDWQRNRQMMLFHVLIDEVDEYHVLAESEDGAISQAHVAAGIDFDDRDNHPSIAQRIPLIIRGWSANQF